MYVYGFGHNFLRLDLEGKQMDTVLTLRCMDIVVGVSDKFFLVNWLSL